MSDVDIDILTAAGISPEVAVRVVALAGGEICITGRTPDARRASIALALLQRNNSLIARWSHPAAPLVPYRALDGRLPIRDMIDVRHELGLDAAAFAVEYARAREVEAEALENREVCDRLDFLLCPVIQLGAYRDVTTQYAEIDAQLTAHISAWVDAQVVTQEDPRRHTVRETLGEHPMRGAGEWISNGFVALYVPAVFRKLLERLTFEESAVNIDAAMEQIGSEPGEAADIVAFWNGYAILKAGAQYVTIPAAQLWLVRRAVSPDGMQICKNVVRFTNAGRVVALVARMSALPDGFDLLLDKIAEVVE